MRLAVPLFTLALAALPLAGSAAAPALPAQELLAGTQGGIQGPARGIVRTPTDFENLAQRLYPRSLPPNLPTVDFSTHIVVYYVLSTAMRASTRVLIKGASLVKGVLRVEVELARSDPSCLGPASLTSPFSVATVPVPAADVQRADFDVVHKSYPCR